VAAISLDDVAQPGDGERHAYDERQAAIVVHCDSPQDCASVCAPRDLSAIVVPLDKGLARIVEWSFDGELRQRISLALDGANGVFFPGMMRSGSRELTCAKSATAQFA
jgi:hypothetical protein